MKIQFTSRPLSEITLTQSSELSEEEIQKINNWCKQYATFLHSQENEYLFWIPPFVNCKKILEGRYGKDIPKIIFDILYNYSKEQQHIQDAGYLLIAFI